MQFHSDYWGHGETGPWGSLEQGGQLRSSSLLTDQLLPDSLTWGSTESLPDNTGICQENTVHGKVKEEGEHPLQIIIQQTQKDPAGRRPEQIRIGWMDPVIGELSLLKR